MPDNLALKDVLGPIISTVAAGLSAFFFWLSYQKSKRDANRSIYVDGQKFIIEICKQLISEPMLWCLYDDSPLKTQKANEIEDSLFQQKLRAFAHLHLNMFEIVVNEVPKPGFGRKKNPSNVWFNYFHDTLKRSQLVRDVLDEPESKNIWSPVLLKEYLKWKVLHQKQSMHVDPQKPPHEKQRHEGN
jgi:hypothetical protein